MMRVSVPLTARKPVPRTAWRRERIEAPIAEEFTGRWKCWSWVTMVVVGSLLWTAFFAWVLS